MFGLATASDLEAFRKELTSHITNTVGAAEKRLREELRRYVQLQIELNRTAPVQLVDGSMTRVELVQAVVTSGASL